MRVSTRTISARAATVLTALMLAPPAASQAAPGEVVRLKLSVSDHAAEAGARGLETGGFRDAGARRGTTVAKLRWTRGARRVSGLVLASYDAAGGGRLCVRVAGSARKRGARVAGRFRLLGGTRRFARLRGGGRLGLKSRATATSALLAGRLEKRRRRGLPAKCRRLLRLSTRPGKRAAIVPVGDAYVSASAPRMRFGSAAALRVRRKPATVSHLRFKVGTLSGEVRRASLRLFAHGSSRHGYLVNRVADTGWRERKLTFAGAPRPGVVVGASGPFFGGWTTADVTPLVTGTGTVTLALTAPAGATDLASRETRMFSPQLVIETAPRDVAPPAAPAPSPPPAPRPPPAPAPAAPADADAPRPTLSQPAAGARTNDTTPRLAGAAGTAPGDAQIVTVKVYAGDTASGTPVRTLDATRVGDGYAVDVAPALAAGAYTAQAAQADSAGNVGYSAPAGFTVDTTAPRVTLGQPADGSLTTDTTPAFAGDAGDATGDSATIGVRVYRGASATGLPAHTLAATRGGAAWAVTASGALEPGTYTARAVQDDAAGNSGLSATSTFTIEEPAAPDPKIAAAGDIACAPTHASYNGGAGTATACRQRYTSDLLVGAGYDAVLALGDLQYEKGEYSYFQEVFDPSWGRVKSLIRPVPGNHEYATAGASGYFDYFNGVDAQDGAAGERDRGYYSFDIDNWHVVALNSNCSAIGGCHAGSAQERWLREDLAAHPSSCILAYWHHPLFNSGNNGPSPQLGPLWSALYDAQADLVLAGHAHSYERFARQAPDGSADPERGIRQITAGMGGKTLHGFGTIVPNSGVRNGDTYGVLELTLGDDGYEWRYVPEAGGSFSDSGSDSCTGPTVDTEPPAVPDDLGGAPSPAGVDLTWTASTDDDGVAGYKVLRDGVEIGTTRTASYTDTTVQPDTTYAYRVVARDAVGNESASTPAVEVVSGRANELRFAPAADAWIEEGTPDENYGDESRLQVDGKPKRDFLARFTVDGVDGRPVTAARLRLWVEDGSPDGGGSFHPVDDDSWGEGTVTWANAPAASGPALGALGRVSPGTWVELDVSSYVTGDGTYSFRATSAEFDGADYASREGGPGQVPQLIVVRGD